MINAQQITQVSVKNVKANVFLRMDTALKKRAHAAYHSVINVNLENQMSVKGVKKVFKRRTENAGEGAQNVIVQ